MTLEGTQQNGVDAFERFWRAFPQRPGADPDGARDAWRRALARGADPEAMIARARAYAAAVEGRERRYVMSAHRWLAETRWRDAAAGSGPSRPCLVWIEYGGPAWEAWSAFWRATKGKTPPLDRLGGWRFPSRWPPKEESRHSAET